MSSCVSKNEADNLNFSIAYFKDLQEIETINSIKNKKMKVLKNPKIGFENGVYWFKVTLLKKTNEKDIVFDLPESNIHKITVYQDSKIIQHKELTNTHFSLLVHFEPQNPIYYLKVRFDNEVYFPLNIKLYKVAQLQEKYTFFINGAYYGFALLALILNIFFYFSLKDRTFIFYSFFLAAIALGVLAYDGLLQTIFPPSFSKYLTVSTHFFITFFGFLFGYKFLNTSYYLPKGNKIGFFLLFIATGSYLLFFLTQAYLYVAIADTVSFFVLLHNWILGILILKKHEFAKFFVIGYSLLLFSTALFIIPVGWGLNMYSTSLSSIKLGALFEMLILTYAITYRVTILQKENESYKLEINKYLHKINSLKREDKENAKTNIEVLISEHDLSERESDVLLLIFKGYTNQRIADELFISLNTVKYHIRNIYQKLNIKSKNEAIDVLSSIQEDVS